MKSDTPNRFNTCILIVTYNPDLSFVKNLARHHEIVENIVVVDNNSVVSIESILPKVFLHKIEIIHSLSNRGIAWALNVGIDKARKLGCDWIITFDQDSLPPSDLLSYYSTVLKSEKDVGLIGVQFSEDFVAVPQISWKESLTTITSGTLHPIGIFDIIGFYNEKLFIDCVDFDFTLRVKLAGYKVIRIDQPLLIHKLGNPIKKYGIVSSNHNSIRRYYYSRNHLFITKTYFRKFPFWILKKNFFFIKSILTLVIVEGDILDKLTAILKGLKDGCKDF